jgi:KaiC/GvpD/RAD55 family RecA-like ATPase
MIEQVAEQYGWNSEEKLNNAKQIIIELVSKMGLTITDLELDVLIESVCNSFKQSIKD